MPLRLPGRNPEEVSNGDPVTCWQGSEADNNGRKRSGGYTKQTGRLAEIYLEYRRKNLNTERNPACERNLKVAEQLGKDWVLFSFVYFVLLYLLSPPFVCMWPKNWSQLSMLKDASIAKMQLEGRGEMSQEDVCRRRCYSDCKTGRESERK